MAVKLAFNGLPRFEDSNGNALNGGLLFTYAAGSTTKQTTYQDSGSITSHANPIVLNSRGEPPAAIWLTAGSTYKFVLAPSTDTDPPASAIWSVDNISGINDTTSAVDQWLASGLTPTYVSATSFTASGDQTSALHVGRRLKTTNTGGTIYSTITASSHSLGTTTVTVDNDSGSLDSGLSAVSYGMLSSTNSSVPGPINVGDVPVLSAVGTLRGANAAPYAMNCKLAWSVGSSILTVALKGRDGNDPSDSNPVLIPFRSATAANGEYEWVAVTAAASIAINNTALLGTVNSVAFRLWVVAFNDGGTVRLGVINCVSSAAGGGSGRDITSIYPLSGWGIASSTQEGDAADSAQVFYTDGAAVTSKGYTVLGYGTWESGLATAGTWSAGPTRTQAFMQGTLLPGQTVQVQRNDSGAVATGTTTVPLDDTIPQIGEGDQYMTQAITPTSAANILRVVHQGDYAASAQVFLTCSIFQDATANALGTTSVTVEASGHTIRLSPCKQILSSTTSATTFRTRTGPNGAATVTFNGGSGSRQFGGVINSYFEAMEIMG